MRFLHISKIDISEGKITSPYEYRLTKCNHNNMSKYRKNSREINNTDTHVCPPLLGDKCEQDLADI